MAGRSVSGFNGGMLRRVIATILWAYFGWYLAAHIVALADLPFGLAILGGAAMAAVASVDVRRLRRPGLPPNAVTDSYRTS